MRSSRVLGLICAIVAAVAPVTLQAAVSSPWITSLRRQKAIEYMKKADALPPGDGDPMSNADEALALAQVYLGDAAGAKKRAQGLSGPFSGVGLLAKIATAQAKIGDTAGAKQTLAQAATGASGNDDWKEIGVASAQVGDVKGAQTALGQLPASRERSEVLATLALSEARAHDAVDAHDHFGQAIRVLEQSPPDAHAFWTMGEIASYQAEAGDAGGALQTLENDKDGADTARYRTHVFALLARHGRRQQAEQVLLERQQQLTNPAPGDFEDKTAEALAWVSLASNWQTLGDSGHVIQAVDHIEILASQIKDSEWAPELLADAADLRLAMGDLSNARLTYERAGEKARPLVERGAGCHALWIMADQQAHGRLANEASRCLWQYRWARSIRSKSGASPAMWPRD